MPLATEVRRRGPQRRSELTRQRLLDAATTAFAEVGFDGTNAATLEASAGVQRGLLAYHFETKDSLWRTVVDRLFDRVRASVVETIETIRLMPDMTPFRAFIASTIRVASAVPELQRIINQESKLGSERADYLIERHIKPFMDMIGRLLGLELTVFDYYNFVSVCTMIYATPHQAKKMFGVDPFSDEFVAAHIKSAIGLLHPREAEMRNGQFQRIASNANDGVTPT